MTAKHAQTVMTSLIAPASIECRLVRVLTAIFFLNATLACRPQKIQPSPYITFTKIPPAAEGGREKVDTIAGRVRNARPGQQIVIYARSGPWWVQPWPDHALIPIRADSTWSTETHLGFEYAALLVDADYHPLPTMDVAPTSGGAVSLVNVVKGTGTPTLAPTKPLRFSGYDWDARTIASDRGGLNNLYDPDNAWTDANGALRLQIKRKDGRWRCAEIVLHRSFGYGTYKLTVRDTSRLEPAAVFSMITWDEAGNQNYREMDVEVSRWGDSSNKSNSQYVIQPFYIPGNVFPFVGPSGTLTHVLRWESGIANFKTFRGTPEAPGTRAVSEHEFTSGIPSPGQARLHLIFYVIASDKNRLQNDSEVVIDKFEYVP